MAEVTVNNQGVFPIGTVVKAYPASGWGPAQLPPSGAPKGSSVAEATISGEGKGVLTGLTLGTRYFVTAEVGGVYRYVSVMAAAPKSARQPRVESIASSATPSINADATDQFDITALAAAITGVTVTGTPQDGQKLIVRILDNGTARAIAWGSQFVARGATLPTTTVISKYTYVGLIYNATASKWDCVAVSQEA